MNHRYSLIILSCIGALPAMEQPPRRKSRSGIITHLEGSGKNIQHLSTKGHLVRSATSQRLATDLVTAVQESDYDRVKLLLAGNAPVNPDTPNQEAPLFEALAANIYNDKIFAKLLQYHADPNRSSGHITPLAQAITNGNSKAALRLIYAGATLLEPIKIDPIILIKELFYKINKSQLDHIRHLLALGAPINVHSPSKKPIDDEQDTPLLCTIRDSKDFNPPLFELILERADVNFCARGGLSPLYKAILFSNEAAALRLINHGADLEYEIPFYQEKSLNIEQLAAAMNMPKLIAMIKSLHEKQKSAQKQLAVSVSRDELIATLDAQSTPLTKSPRAEAQKP